MCVMLQYQPDETLLSRPAHIHLAPVDVQRARYAIQSAYGQVVADPQQPPPRRQRNHVSASGGQLSALFAAQQQSVNKTCDAALSMQRDVQSMSPNSAIQVHRFTRVHAHAHAHRRCFVRSATVIWERTRMCRHTKMSSVATARSGRQAVAMRTQQQQLPAVDRT